jgi:hypothetical protein
MPVVYVGLPTLYYLLYIFTTFGAAIALALILATILAYKSFDEVEKRAVRLGRPPFWPTSSGWVWP